MSETRSYDELAAEVKRLEAETSRRRRLDGRLKKHLRFTESLLMAIPTPVFYKDAKGRYQGCNRAFTDLMGLTPEAMRGKVAGELWPDSHAKVYQEKDLELIRTRQHQEYEYLVRDRNGVDRSVIFNKDVFLGENGEVAGVVGAFLDISERKRAEEAMKNSEAFAKKVLDASLAGLYICDAETGRIVFTNARFTALTGLSLEALREASGRTLCDRFHPEDRSRVTAHLDAVRQAKDGEVLEAEYRFQTLDGRWIHCLSRDSVFSRNADGSAGQLIGAFLDITPWKRAEAELIRLNANLEALVDERTALAEKRTAQLQQLAVELSTAEERERRRLATVLHDDLQQDMALIKLRLSLLQPADGRLRGEFRILDQLIQESIHKSRRLSYELDPPVLRRDGFTGALDWLAGEMKTLHGLKVSVQASPGAEPDSPALASILFRSIRELLINVAKYAGTRSAWVDVGDDGDCIRVCVSDSGKGCDPAAVMGRRGADTGFGLFSIEDRVNFLGGAMEIQSAVGEGCSITLRVPMRIGKVQAGHRGDFGRRHPDRPSGAGDPHRQEAAHGIRILIADDHDLMREGLATLLNGEDGLRVVAQAADGLEAVRLAAEHRPQVVLMDVSMPVMNGIAATAEIRQLLPDARIIGLSIHDDPDTRRQMIQAGACAYLSKTGSPEALILAVQQAASPGA